MTELQTDAPADGVIETTEADLSESPVDNQEAESAPAEANPQPEKVEFSEDQQKVFNDAIAKKTWQMREEQRKNEELQRQLQQVQSQIPQQARPVIPELPDPYDDDYEDRVKQRDQAILAQARYDAEQNVKLQQAQQAALQEQYQKQQEQQKMISSYADRAQKLGVDPVALQQAGNAVAQMGVNDDVTTFILQDDHGPLITEYLAANPMELDAMRGVPSYMAVLNIAQNIKPKLAAKLNKTPAAPAPTDTLSGSGVSAERGAKGATFE